MGGLQTKNYKSKESEVYSKLTSSDAPQTRRDGTLLRRKEHMIKDYDESILPWPLKPLIKLDYCWRLNYLVFKHSFVLAIPITGIHFMWNNPNYKRFTWQTFPKLLTLSYYVIFVLLFATANVGFNICFEDYW